MKVKNLCQNPVADICARMALDLHDIETQWTDSEPADILICDAYTDYNAIRSYPATLKLCFDLQHAAADKHRGWSNVGWVSYKDAESVSVIIECEDPGFQQNQIVFYDFLWNRSKAYYTNRPWKLTNPWYHCGNDAYKLQPLSQAHQKTRLFLSPSKVGRPNSPYRSRLTDLVQRHDFYQLGYYSALTFDSTSSVSLMSNSRTPDAETVAAIDARWGPAINGYDPVHNAYYNETFFSVYVETLETGTTQFITEKTLDPLIKGHFILPFSSPGFVNYLKSRGWRLPEFIDYSYDCISDDELRFRKFREEFFRLCSLSLDTWRQLWIDNFDIIEYNRNQLYHRPYDYLEILNAKV